MNCECGHNRDSHMWRIDHRRGMPDPSWCHDCECKTYAPSVTDNDLHFGNHLTKEVIDRLAQNAIDATPMGEVIDFEKSLGREQ